MGKDAIEQVGDPIGVGLVAEGDFEMVVAAGGVVDRSGGQERAR